MPELQKPPGVLCKNCKPGAGCTIYDKRPQLCREWYCGWRLLPFGEEWRPDRCQILVMMLTETMLKGLKYAVQINLIGSHDRISWQPLVSQIATFISNNVPVFLAVPGKAGHVFAQTYLNTFQPLREAIAIANFEMTVSALAQALQSCIDHPKPKYEFLPHVPTGALEPHPRGAAAAV